MYFRRKKTNSGEVTQLLQSYRNARGHCRNRVVVSLGKLDIPEEMRTRVAKAVGQELSGQPDLLGSDYTRRERELIQRILRLIDIRGSWAPLAETRANGGDEAQKEERPVEGIVDGVIIDAVNHTAGAELGPELVGLSVWNQLKISDCLRCAGFNQAQIARAAALVVNRLVEPVGEHALPLWLKGTALPELLGDGLLDCSDDSFYRAGDKLLVAGKDILRHVRAMESAELNLDRSILLYDLTNTYFEGSAAENPKAKRGNSKHKRNDCPQIVVGMVFDRNGFELGHQIFEGNRNDSTTLLEMIDGLDKATGLKDELPLDTHPLIIMDGGIATKKNLRLLRERNYRYLVNDSRRGRGRYRNWFLDHQNDFSSIPGRDGDAEVLVKLLDDPLPNDAENMPGDRIVLCKSAARRQKELAIRSKTEERFLDELKKINASVQKGTIKDAQKIERKIGALQKKYSRAAKFHEINLLENGQGLTWNSKGEKLKADDDLLGCYVLRSNMEELAPEVLWNLYMTLTRAEDGFRAIKGDLGIRPNYHREEERVDAHVFISVLAYHLWRYITYKLERANDHRSWTTIKRILKTHDYTTVVVPTINQEVYRIRKAAIPDLIQKDIYRKLNVGWTGLPSSRTRAPMSN